MQEINIKNLDVDFIGGVLETPEDEKMISAYIAEQKRKKLVKEAKSAERKKKEIA